MATSVCKQNTRQQATKMAEGSLLQRPRSLSRGSGAGSKLPFPLAIAFESYSKIFKDKTNQSKAKAALQLGTLWGTNVSKPAPLIQMDRQTDR